MIFNSSPTRTRAFAAIGVGLIGDADSADALLALADSKRAERHLDIPVAAVTALGLLSDRDPLVTAGLADIVRDRRAADVLRSAAVVALGRREDPEATPAIRRALRDSSLVVRRSAVLALGRVADPEDETSYAMLRAIALKGSDSLSRNWACIALGRMGAAAAEKPLKELAFNGSGALQAFGALGLALWGKATDDTTVGAALRSGLTRVRSESTLGAFAIALGILGDATAEDDLLRLLRTYRSPELRGYAAVALGMIQARGAVPEIRELVGDSGGSPWLRKSAAIALGLVGDRDAVDLLVRVVESARTEYVQSAAALALGFIGDRSSVPVLERLMTSRAVIPELARAQATVALGVVAEARPLPALHVLAVDANYRALVESLAEILTFS